MASYGMKVVSYGMNSAGRLLCGLCLLAGASLISFSQVSVVTQHNDIGRTGQNTSETILTPANVNATQFGKLFTTVVDGPVYAQPLYMPGVTVPTKGVHNIVFVATENDSVYALDADTNGGTASVPLWVANLATSAHGALPGSTAVPSLDIGTDIVPTVGITGTPVIDPVAGSLYVVSFTLEKGQYILRLHALKITNGAERPGSPVVIQASVTGTGNGSSNSVLAFDPKWENQRPGLLLLNGVVYIGFAAHGDVGPWHGWLLAYNAVTLKQISAYCASPNGVGAGFWMSGAGLAADTDQSSTDPLGRVFAVAGNGDYSATSSSQADGDYGDSILNLSLRSKALGVRDSFTPSEQAYLDASDGDLGAGGALVVPDADSPTPLLIQSGKEGKIYLLNRNNLGGYNSPDKVVQELANGTTSTKWGAGIWGMPAYWNKTLYFPGRSGPLKAFTLSNGLLSTSAADQTSEILEFPTPTPSISANGNTSGIVWLLEASHSSAPGAVLEAYNASKLSSLLYSSQTKASRDGLSHGVKYAVPTIANGKVYVASSESDPFTGATYGQLNVFGLLNGIATAPAPVITPGTKTFSTSLSVTITDANAGAVIYYTTDGTTPSGVSPRYTKPFPVTSNETVTAMASVPGLLQSGAVSATYTSSSQVPDPVISPATGIFTNSVPVTITDSLKSAAIYYTTDGSIPTTSSHKYAGAFSLKVPATAAVTLKAIGVASGLQSSDTITRNYEIKVEGTSLNFSKGFSPTGSLTLNGSAQIGDDSRLQLTNGAFNQAGSVFSTQPLQINAFTTEFTFQLSNPAADGFTFTVQGIGNTALGKNSSGLGYAGMQDSMALKFDFFNDAGEGTDSTGIFVNGATPTVIGSVNLTGSGIDLSSGDPFDALLVYGNDTLDVTITDTFTHATWSTAFSVNLTALAAGPTAYVGFTGSSNSTKSSSQKIETWTYLSGASKTPVTSTPAFSLPAGTYSTSQTVAISDGTSGAKIYYTTDGSNPSTSSKLYSGPLPVTKTQSIHAMALAPGDLVSPIAAITYTIGN